MVNVQHARLRMHCSNLKEHLYSKNIVDSPLCECGEIEDTYHYIFTCPLYSDERHVLASQLINHPLSLQLLFFGSNDVSDDVNKTIFKAVQVYIQTTNRFAS